MSNYYDLPKYKTHGNGIITMENQTWYDCWIDNMITGDHIVLPQTPVNWSENYSASYANQEIIGSSRPRIMYTGTSLRTMSFSIQNLSLSYLPVGYNSLKEYVRTIQALCFPEYSSTGVITAPDCHLQFGDRGWQGVFTAINVSWGDEVYNQGSSFKITNYTRGNETEFNQNRLSRFTSNVPDYEVSGGERMRCNIEFSFTNTRLKSQIPGATWIRNNG